MLTGRVYHTCDHSDEGFGDHHQAVEEVQGLGQRFRHADSVAHPGAYALREIRLRHWNVLLTPNVAIKDLGTGPFMPKFEF